MERLMKIRETVTRIKAALAGATIAVVLGVTGLVTVGAQGADSDGRNYRAPNRSFT